MCSKKTKLRKYKSPIIDASIQGERGSKKKDPKAIITIYRKDGTSTIHFHSQIETFGYYEWLEMREVIQKEKSTNKKYIEDDLKCLLSRMSKGVKVPPIQPRSQVELLLYGMRQAPASLLKMSCSQNGRLTKAC